MCTYSPQRVLGLAVAAALAACGGSDLTLPADGLPSDLRAVSGDGQEATAGSRLPDPLIVRLTDAGARPVAGVSVAFRFDTDVPGAKVEPATIATDDTGFASVRVQLGSTTGPQTIEARLADSASSRLRATFGLTALAPKESGGGDGGGGGGGGDHGHGGGD